MILTDFLIPYLAAEIKIYDTYESKEIVFPRGLLWKINTQVSRVHESRQPDKVNEFINRVKVDYKFNSHTLIFNSYLGKIEFLAFYR